MKLSGFKLVFISVGALAWGCAAGSDLRMPFLGACVSQLPEDETLAVKVCEAKQARFLMTTGQSRCAGASGVVGGRILCAKSDSSSEAADAGVEFGPYHAKLVEPVSIGDVRTFYAGKSAGENDRFHVAPNDDDLLTVTDGEASPGDEVCAFEAGSESCLVIPAFRGGVELQRRVLRNYALRLDGLLVEEHAQLRRCEHRRCIMPNMCHQRCLKYLPHTSSKAASRLYPWN